MKTSQTVVRSTWVRRSRAIALIVFTLGVAPQWIVAQDGSGLFRGEVGSTLTTLIAADGEFDSAINPSNALGLSDLFMMTNANLRVEQRMESASLDFRIDFSAYPIGDALAVPYILAGAPDPLLAYAAGETIWSADITRAAVLWYATDLVQVTLGRQTLVNGYGFVWSPYDLASPPRDPADPAAFLRGVDGVSVSIAPSWNVALTAYAILPGGTAEFEGVVAGADASVLAGPAEFRVAGLYGGSEEGTSDPYPHSAAMAAYVDLLGVGLYGEAALRSRSRVGVLESNGTQSELSGPVWSALGGVEYVFASGTTLLVEYFFNGEGWDEDQRTDFLAGVSAAPSVANIGLYRPGAYSRHYAMINLSIPLVAASSDLTASSVFAADTGTLFLNPALTINLDSTGNLTCDVMYTGILDLYGDDTSEAELSPAEHQIALALKFAF